LACLACFKRDTAKQAEPAVAAAALDKLQKGELRILPQTPVPRSPSGGQKAALPASSCPALLLFEVDFHCSKTAQNPVAACGR